MLVSEIGISLRAVNRKDFMKREAHEAEQHICIHQQHELPATASGKFR